MYANQEIRIVFPAMTKVEHWHRTRNDLFFKHSLINNKLNNRQVAELLQQRLMNAFWAMKKIHSKY